MTRGVRVVAGVLVGIAALVLLRQATAVMLPGPSRHGEAWVRLSWAARPERVETCRRLTDEELAKRPAHMRLRVECTGRFARYRLSVHADGAPLVLDTVQGSGLRNDRPMHVLREIPVAAGERRVQVTLVRIDSAPAAMDMSQQGEADSSGVPPTDLLGERGRREVDERARSTAAAIAPTLVLDTTMMLDPGRVLLVTYDGDTRQLVAVAGPGQNEP